MSEATGGRPERSARFRDLLTPAGIGPELRSAFVADGATWGALILVRRAGEPDFEDRDVELLSRASSLFARAVRRGLVTEATEPAPTIAARRAGRDRARRPGAPHPASSTAEPLLAELSGTTVEDGLRSTRRSTRSPRDEGRDRGRAAPMPPALGGQDAGRHVARAPRRPLGRREQGRVAIFLQRAHPTLVAPLLLKAYGLTPREQEVAQLTLRGATARRRRERSRSRRTRSTTT